MIRWHHWFIINEFNIEGHMKSIGYRLLGFSEELPKRDYEEKSVNNNLL